jgi:hypothetical protein
MHHHTTLPSTNQPNMQFEIINKMGFFTECNFYVPDEKGDINGLAFGMAYHKATKDFKNNNKELCASVGSMLCSVVPSLRNSVEAALNATGVKPRFVSLPSQAHENNIDISNAPQLDWPSILVMFGYCILLLFYGTTGNHNYIFDCISNLQPKVRYDPKNKLDIPFDPIKIKAVKTMLGSRDLCKTVITFLRNNCNHPDSQVSNMCKHLNTILYGLSLE